MKMTNSNIFGNILILYDNFFFCECVSPAHYFTCKAQKWDYLGKASAEPASMEFPIFDLISICISQGLVQVNLNNLVMLWLSFPYDF